MRFSKTQQQPEGIVQGQFQKIYTNNHVIIQYNRSYLTNGMFINNNDNVMIYLTLITWEVQASCIKRSTNLILFEVIEHILEKLSNCLATGMHNQREIYIDIILLVFMVFTAIKHVLKRMNKFTRQRANIWLLTFRIVSFLKNQ